jgi:hypothetical protein
MTDAVGQSGDLACHVGAVAYRNRNAHVFRYEGGAAQGLALPTERLRRPATT